MTSLSHTIDFTAEQPYKWGMKPVPLAIVAALDDEIRIIRSRMAIDSRHHTRPALFVSGIYQRSPLLLVRSGIGRQAMDRAIRYCLDRYHPSFCLHVGYCGGTDPQYHAGDLFIANAIVDSRSGKRISPPRQAVEKAMRICRDRKLRAKEGALVTVDEPVASPHEKAFVGTQHQAQAMDMESAPLAAACTQHSVPYLVVRAILDPLDYTLPDLCDVVEDTGATNRMALVGRLIRKPGHLLKLPSMSYFAAQARMAITSFVDAWVAEQKEGE
jgi:adenosylhomocysteine nucleosidase